jgi:hypothetical protein
MLVKWNRQMGFQVEIAIRDKYQINQASTRSVPGVLFWVYLYKTYCAKSLLRKHYKEGASVVTHFWIPHKIYIYKNMYIAKKG